MRLSLPALLIGAALAASAPLPAMAGGQFHYVAPNLTFPAETTAPDATRGCGLPPAGSLVCAPADEQAGT